MNNVVQQASEVVRKTFGSPMDNNVLRLQRAFFDRFWVEYGVYNDDIIYHFIEYNDHPFPEGDDMSNLLEQVFNTVLGSTDRVCGDFVRDPSVCDGRATWAVKLIGFARADRIVLWDKLLDEVFATLDKELLAR